MLAKVTHARYGSCAYAIRLVRDRMRAIVISIVTNTMSISMSPQSRLALVNQIYVNRKLLMRLTANGTSIHAGSFFCTTCSTTWL